MDLDTSTLMMIFFILVLIISILKIYVFLPNKQLEDDDTTKESKEELMQTILKIIKDSDENLTESELFKRVNNDKNFNEELFWRFNLNKLKQLLNLYYIMYPDTSSIKDIYKKLNL
jgi:hypothetical protein